MTEPPKRVLGTNAAAEQGGGPQVETQEQLDPQPPRPPGTPEIDLDVPIDVGDQERPEAEDVEPGAGGVEPSG
jgi:hypothetical protein